ncbi:MAG: DUF465 domain-containing protein [Alphaproteobacteria bacterium]|nr:DUF465 domain-containing protein [Alphaproteobacteria bacterium]
MALENRIEALKKKHADIDLELQKEALCVSVDSLTLSRLKATKLSVKDEIERLQEAQAVA